PPARGPYWYRRSVLRPPVPASWRSRRRPVPPKAGCDQYATQPLEPSEAASEHYLSAVDDRLGPHEPRDDVIWLRASVVTATASRTSPSTRPRLRVSAAAGPTSTSPGT